MILRTAQQYKMYANKKSNKIGDSFTVETFKQEQKLIDNTSNNRNKRIKHEIINIPIKGEFMITSRDDNNIGIKCLKCDLHLAPPVSFSTICHHMTITECTDTVTTNNNFNTITTNNSNNSNDVNHDINEKFTENKNKQLLCQVCNVNFSKRSHLNRHLFSAHGLGDRSVYKCKTCSKVFTQRYSLTRHIKTVHQVIDSQVDEFVMTIPSMNQINSQCNYEYNQQQQQQQQQQQHVKCPPCLR